MRRVVITGQGAICALGEGVPTILNAMKNAECGIGQMDFVDVDRLSIQIGAQVKNFVETERFSARELTFYDRFTQFALVAAKEAIENSGIHISDDIRENCGVVIGTSGGGLGTQDENYRQVFQEGKNRVHPFVVPRLMNNAASSHISMVHGLKGPNFTVSSACASSNHAMAQAFATIQSGFADVMVTGGAEAMLCFGGIKAWEGLRVMSKDGCRPFSKDRNGMVQGEGAGVFVFEEYEHAKARGANILAEIVGFGICADAGDIVTPAVDGAVRAMRGAIKQAKINPDQIGYINAHGTATQMNDKTESAAICEVFGSKTPLVSSTKSMHGHLIGGTGGIELLAAIMAIHEGIVAPTINHNEADPEINLDVVPNEARDIKTDYVVSNALAFGGLNAVIALGRV